MPLTSPRIVAKWHRNENTFLCLLDSLTVSLLLSTFLSFNRNHRHSLTIDSFICSKKLNIIDIIGIDPIYNTTIYELTCGSILKIGIKKNNFTNPPNVIKLSISNILKYNDVFKCILIEGKTLLLLTVS